MVRVQGKKQEMVIRKVWLFGETVFLHRPPEAPGHLNYVEEEASCPLRRRTACSQNPTITELEVSQMLMWCWVGQMDRFEKPRLLKRQNNTKNKMKRTCCQWNHQLCLHADKSGVLARMTFYSASHGKPLKSPFTFTSLSTDIFITNLIKTCPVVFLTSILWCNWYTMNCIYLKCTICCFNIEHAPMKLSPQSK